MTISDAELEKERNNGKIAARQDTTGIRRATVYIALQTRHGSLSFDTICLAKSKVNIRERRRKIVYVCLRPRLLLVLGSSF